MKKLLILIVLSVFLVGCGKETSKDMMQEFKSKITDSKSYVLKGSMEISNDEETFTYSLESYYLKDNYYKVVLVNQTNNHEQIILKNKEDIYVITPSLNKSFKFQSEWPENSSQAYLLGNLKSDVENDKNAEIKESDNGYIIKSNVNYPNNEDLVYQKIYLNKDKVLEKVEVYNESDIVKIKVIIDSIDLKANLKEENFKLEDYIKEDSTEEENNKEESSKEESDKENNNMETETENCNSEEECKDDNTKTETNSNTDSTTNEENEEDDDANDTTKNTANIENIIYPLYIPSNTYLTSSERIETTTGDRVILTFSGEKTFVLIEEVAMSKDEMEIIPVYGEPLMLSEAIGALSANSLSWDSNNISYYLASTELTVSEMQTIANSLGNTTLVNGTK